MEAFLQLTERNVLHGFRVLWQRFLLRPGDDKQRMRQKIEANARKLLMATAQKIAGKRNGRKSIAAWACMHP